MQLLLFSQSERCTRPPCSRSAAPDGATTHILVRRLAQRRHEQLSTCRIEPAGRSNAPGDWPDARLGLGQREVGRGERWRCSAGAGGVLSRPFASIAKPALFGKVPPHRGGRTSSTIGGVGGGYTFDAMLTSDVEAMPPQTDSAELPAMRALANQARDGPRPFAMLVCELRREPRLRPAGRGKRSPGEAERAGGVPTVCLGAVA